MRNFKVNKFINRGPPLPKPWETDASPLPLPTPFTIELLRVSQRQCKHFTLKNTFSSKIKKLKTRLKLKFDESLETVNILENSSF